MAISRDTHEDHQNPHRSVGVTAAGVAASDGVKMTRLPSPLRRRQLRLLRGLMRTPESVLDEIATTVGPVPGSVAAPSVSWCSPTRQPCGNCSCNRPTGSGGDHPLSPFPFAIGETTMLASSGDDHRRRRGAVQEAFSRRRLDRWIPMIIEQTDVAIDQLLAVGAAERPVDVAPWAKRLVIETVVHALFGDRLIGRTDDIEQRFQRIQDHLGGPLWGPAPHPFPFGFRAAVGRDRDALDEMIDGEIAAIRRSTDHDPFDILAALVDQAELTDAEIRDQVKTLIGAGYDTTSSSLPGWRGRPRRARDCGAGCGSRRPRSSAAAATLSTRRSNSRGGRCTRPSVSIPGRESRHGSPQRR